VESRLLPVESVTHPTKLERGTSKFAFTFFHTPYTYTLRPILAHICINYWLLCVWKTVVT